ncbi:MAG TPA: hydroxyisourate hydrolase [Sphingobium sp.]
MASGTCHGRSANREQNPPHFRASSIPIAAARTYWAANRPAGSYHLTFAVAALFPGPGHRAYRSAFLDKVSIDFGVAEDGHHHVPLLVYPFCYSPVGAADPGRHPDRTHPLPAIRKYRQLFPAICRIS